MTETTSNITLSSDEISKLRKRRNSIKSLYGARNTLFTRYEDIFFMRNVEKPKQAGVDPNDWKVTASPGGRDKVTGLKRILDTSEIHIKVKEKGKGKAEKSDQIEAALKTMLRVSGEYKAARNERDTNLAAILYGPVVLTVDSVDDLITTKKSAADPDGVNLFITKQLETIRKRTPFLINTINPKESYPEWGAYGMVGHVQEYNVYGSELKERWGAGLNLSDDKEYLVTDFFHYDKRLVEAGNTTLFAGQWLTDFAGVSNIPIFVRYAGGSTLFSKPEEQLSSFLYAYAKGEWDKRENLFWTYIFTAIYTQGLPGPTILRDPDDTSEIKVDYRGGVKIITARGKLENVQVIDSDAIQLKGMMDQVGNQSTIQEQTIGGTAQDTTFSGYVMSVNAGKLPAVDPTEAQEHCFADAFLHILQRIKAGGIDNDLIDANDIPDDVELEVSLEPDLQQDDLRNSQIVSQLKTSGANVSDEWLNTNLLKIADSNTMFRQKTKEDIKKAIVANIMQNPQLLQQFVMAAMGQQAQPPAGPTPPEQAVPTGGEQQQVPPGYHVMPDGSLMPDSEMPPEGAGASVMPGAGGETMPQTDAMIPPGERR